MVTDTRPHVMRVYSRLEVGGIERQMLRVLPALNGGRYRVSLCLLKRAGELAEELRREGVAVHVLPLEGRLSPRSLWSLARLFRSQSVSIVHAHVRESNTTATVAARLARVPVVIASVHNMTTIRGRRRVLQDRLLDRWRDAVVTVSERVRDDYCRTVGIDPGKCVTIYNGLDIEAFRASAAPRPSVRASLGLGEDHRIVVTVARLVQQKAHEVLLEAAARVAAGLPQARFLVVGEGERREELERIAAGRGLVDRVLFLGGRSDIASLYAAADVSCLTSDREGFSNVVVESLASGLPVVTTDVGGNREAVEDGVSGYILPARDAEGIANRLRALLADDAVRSRMSQAAVVRAGRFSLLETRLATEALYDRLLEARRPGQRAF